MRDRKEYMAKYHREWYERNKEKHKANVERNKVRIYAEYTASKMRSCADCGFVPTVADQMHYDHLRDKKHTISRLSRSGSQRRLEEEITKCDLVCANCHALRTALRRQ
jgi:hypothetical protein